MCAPRRVIQALDVASIYDVPVAYHAEGLDREVLAVFGIANAPSPISSAGGRSSRRIASPEAR